MERFDVIVVGAGSAGAALAARLSEKSARSVLLLEAGSDHNSADTPDGIDGLSFFSAIATPGRIWPTLSAVHAEGNDPALYVRGRGVGGSSAVNAMVAIRGTAADYERWARELGCDGWAWSELLPVFRRIEDDVAFGGDALHGQHGPIPLTRLPKDAWGTLDRALVDAALDLGYPWCADYHAPGATGVGPAALNVRDGHRVSTNDAYLEVARLRPNLTIRGDTSVERVIIDGRRAVGVLTVSGDQIDAGEVIISAGAIHSPAILLRSGIGPEIGRPVGENLIEHPGGGLNLSLKEGARIDASNDALLSTVIRYSSGLADAGENDMQIFPLGATFLGPAYGALTAAVMRVFSRGRVSLKSMDANDDPVVEFRMLSDERDIVRLRDGVRRLLALAEHPAIAAITTEVSAGARPLAALDSDEAIDEWLRANVSYYAHAVGTCRMGAAEDPSAVVDPTCRVIGFERLRVVDASVMPDIPRANTHLTTVAIAEHVAAMMTSEPA